MARKRHHSSDGNVKTVRNKPENVDSISNPYATCILHPEEDTLHTRNLLSKDLLGDMENKGTNKSLPTSQDYHSLHSIHQLQLNPRRREEDHFSSPEETSSKDTSDYNG